MNPFGVVYAQEAHYPQGGFGAAAYFAEYLEEIGSRGKIVGVLGFGKDKLYLEEDVNKLLEALCQKIKAKKAAAERLSKI